jgi:anti-anti-sigma regulatory factor
VEPTGTARAGRRAEVVSTLLCRVKRRLPVAVVDLYGTLDSSSAVRGVVSLRERLADQPMALVLEVSHLSMAGGAAAGALLDLADDSANWPGARIALCGAGPGIRALLRDVDSRGAGEAPASTDAALPGAGVDLFDRVEDAVQVALRMPVPPRCTVRLPPDRHAPEQARLTVGRSCTEWAVPRLSQLAQVIVSELVTNAVVHARTPMELTVRLVGDVLELAVRDGDPRLLVDPGGGVAADGHGYGRGLLIVDSMSDSWGCAPTGEGKVVWARLAVPA